MHASPVLTFVTFADAAESFVSADWMEDGKLFRFFGSKV